VAILVFAVALADASLPAGAQSSAPSESEQFAMGALSETRLAFIRTGSGNIDSVAMAGLAGLNAILQKRTAIEPGAPVGLDIERDELLFFPLIYWPILPETKPPSTEALARLDHYMKSGGTIFFDTRDHGSTPELLPGSTSPATEALRAILATLDIPALEPIPPEHVITKAFYLLQTFPGRWSGGNLWVESSRQAPTRTGGNADGVSSIIIGSNDYAAAWATDASGQPMYPAVPGGEQQRELAYRSGVNVVMYALTGNYKADQVHVPALLERLGQ